MVSQLKMIQTKQSQNGGVQVIQVNAILDGPQTDLICRADSLAAFHAATCHPYRETIRIVVAPRPAPLPHRAAVNRRAAAELAPPDYERRIEQISGLQIGEAPCNGLISLG